MNVCSIYTRILLDSSWRRDAGGTSLPFQLLSFGLAEFDGLEGTSFECYITCGWKRLCKENQLAAGDELKFVIDNQQKNVIHVIKVSFFQGLCKNLGF